MFSHLKRANRTYLLHVCIFRFEKVGRNGKCGTINNTVGESLTHFDHRCTEFLNIQFSLFTAVFKTHSSPEVAQVALDTYCGFLTTVFLYFIY